MSFVVVIAFRMATSFSVSTVLMVAQTCPLVATVRISGGSVAVAAPRARARFRAHGVAFVHAQCRANMFCGAVSPAPVA